MYLKATIIALFMFAPVLSVNVAHADEYLIISNLPAGSDTNVVRKRIEAYGEVKSIKCYDIHFTTEIKMSCNVLMWSIENARKVVKAMDGIQFAGRKLYSREIYPVPCPDPIA